MQISQNLKLRQSQSLVMTPQLQQAIKLLQLTNLELCDLVNRELEENPFLENNVDEEVGTVEDKSTENIDDAFDSGESLADDPHNNDYENRWDNEPNLSNVSKNHETIDPGSIAEQTVSEKITLKSFLHDQARLEFDNSNDKIIADFLIDYIEPSGWITKNLDDLCKIIGCEEDELNKILFRMQKFEPTGVFARNLQESLKIQLLSQDLLDEKISILIDNFETLAKGDIKSLGKICKLSNEEILEKIKIIKGLNPKPGSLYSDDNENIYHPDVIVKQKNGEWEVELNKGTLPKITINQGYADKLEKLNCGENDKKFINESIGSAKWLVKAIEQRNITTLKISAEIVDQQKLFFEKGLSYLKPMILKDVAKKINMHESTVSRVTSSKLMLTPRGLLDMKHFFSATINSTVDGESHSAASVRQTLKNLISSEPLNQPFSDEVIVSKLQKEGINLARRTVAKYRELLSIPSSAERRKIMKIQGIHI